MINLCIEVLNCTISGADRSTWDLTRHEDVVSSKWEFPLKNKDYVDGLMQERCNSGALAMELRLSCINSLRPSDAYMRQ